MRWVNVNVISVGSLCIYCASVGPRITCRFNCSDSGAEFCSVWRSVTNLWMWSPLGLLWDEKDIPNWQLIVGCCKAMQGCENGVVSSTVEFALSRFWMNTGFQLVAMALPQTDVVPPRIQHYKAGDIVDTGHRISTVRTVIGQNVRSQVRCFEVKALYPTYSHVYEYPSNVLLTFLQIFIWMYRMKDLGPSWRIHMLINSNWTAQWRHKTVSWYLYFLTVNCIKRHGRQREGYDVDCSRVQERN